MTDGQWMLLVLTVLYLGERQIWSTHASLAFIPYFVIGYTLRRPGKLLGNTVAGLTILSPLPPFNPSFVSPFNPLVFGEDTLLIKESPDSLSVKSIVLSDIRGISSNEKNIIINNEVCYKSDSICQAEYLATILKKQCQVEGVHREDAMIGLLKESLSVENAALAITEFNAKTQWLKIFVTLEFIFIFVFAPLLSLKFGVGAVLLQCAFFLYIFGIPATYFYFKIHSQYYPSLNAERWQNAIQFALFPLALTCVLDKLSRNLLLAYHPLALAKILLPRVEFEKFAEKTFREAAHPLRAVLENEHDGAVLANYDKMFLDEVTGFFVENGIDTTLLLLAPNKNDSDSKSYCPRCLGQYRTDLRECAHCAGVALRDFEIEDKEL